MTVVISCSRWRRDCERTGGNELRWPQHREQIVIGVFRNEPFALRPVKPNE